MSHNHKEFMYQNLEKFDNTIETQIFAHVADRTNGDKECTIAMRFLKKFTNSGHKAVSEAIDNLIDKGLLHVEKTPRAWHYSIPFKVDRKGEIVGEEPKKLPEKHPESLDEKVKILGDRIAAVEAILSRISDSIDPILSGTVRNDNLQVTRVTRNDIVPGQKIAIVPENGPIVPESDSIVPDLSSKNKTNNINNINNNNYYNSEERSSAVEERWKTAFGNVVPRHLRTDRFLEIWAMFQQLRDGKQKSKRGAKIAKLSANSEKLLFYSFCGGASGKGDWYDEPTVCDRVATAIDQRWTKPYFDNAIGYTKQQIESGNTKPKQAGIIQDSDGGLYL